jgi:RND family efflux transporter MFP subunit
MNTFKYFSIGVILLGVILGFAMNNTTEPESQQGNNTIATAYSVSVVPAKKQVLSSEFSVTGTIAAHNDVMIISETQGRVVKVYASVGDYKTAGSVLVEVDSELKEANYKTAKMMYEKAKKDLDRYENLYKEGSIPESQIEQARWSFQSAESQYIIARRLFSDTKITTPISGVVTARYVDIGSTVMGAPQSTLIANVVDISKLKVKVNVAEKDVFQLHVGDQAAVTTDIFPGVEYKGTIASIAVKGDDAHSYPVEITLQNNKQNPLKAGMFGKVQFSPKSATNTIYIPRESIVGSKKNATVFVVENNFAKVRPVVVGTEVGSQVAVISGIKEGELIVVNGQNNLKDNSSVIIRK